ncbi:MAG: transposase, partial [Proteobacteria bacterium]|nr:transposase [Pseudomonadota bacterium]
MAGYEGVNDAERLSRDPAMRAIVERKGLDRRAASASRMGRFETEWLATNENPAALINLSGIWIDRVHDRKTPKMIILDMDSSERTGVCCAGRSAPSPCEMVTGAGFLIAKSARSR